MENEPKIIKFSSLELFLKNHRAIHHPFFNYIKACAKEGFTPKQYQIYRDNYLYRTMHTIPSIAYLTAAAALNGDIETLSLVGKNLFEECGSGDPKKAHSQLLNFSHNEHGKTVFNLNPIQMVDLQHQPTITKETRQFVKQEKDLYQNKNYCIALGAAYAHETAANSMLTHFYESIFLSYKNHYNLQEFYHIAEYFLIHISGLELVHADIAKYSAQKMDTSKENLKDLAEGCTVFLNSQANLWDGLLRELQLASREGKRVPIHPI